MSRHLDGVSSTNPNINWPPKPTVLITGGSGSFGKALTKYLLETHSASVIRVFSRDEYKQYEMRKTFQDQRLRFFIGDVRDLERLKLACKGVDVVIHAAALKQVPACEYNPFEAVQTNVQGTQNVINACIERNVKRAVLISSDKAVDPVNLYGATKMVAEKIWKGANQFSTTRFVFTRWGNVMGSRGSVIPMFEKQKKIGVLTITHPDMTRFWTTLPEISKWLWENVVLGVENNLDFYIPRMKAAKVVDVAKMIAPEAKIEFIGIQQGEKLHEDLGNGQVSSDKKLQMTSKELKAMYESI